LSLSEEILSIVETKAPATTDTEKVQEFMSVLKEQVDGGAPFDGLLSMLKKAGIDEDDAKYTIIMAADGQVKGCARCGNVYSGHLSFCSICGQELKYIQLQ